LYATAIKAMVLFEDDDLMVLNKPFGLAVQGGLGTDRHRRHVGSVARQARAEAAVVHCLDKDTSGVIVVAKTRFAASALAKSGARDTRKIYWALVAGVPRVKQGPESPPICEGEDDEGDQKMQVAKHGDEGASHAVTYYAVVETARNSPGSR